MVQRHVGQIGGAQLGPPAAEVAQTRGHVFGQVVQRHVGQTGGAQFCPPAAKVARTYIHQDGQVVL